MRSTLRKGAVTLIGATAILSLALGSIAQADPHRTNTAQPLAAAQGGFLPDSNDLFGQGSDTTQYVINSAAQAYSFQGGAFVDRRLASYNACQPGTDITPPLVCNDQVVTLDPDQALVSGVPTANGDETTVARRNGSSAGIRGLFEDSTQDFARSSRFRGTDPREADLYFIPALRDGLSYIVDNAVPAGHDIRNLDIADLQAIYSCTDGRGYEPKLPQTGSGTRQFFLDTIGVTTPGPCVDQSVQEHDPSAVDGNQLAIAPFSTARWTNNPPNPAAAPRLVVDIAATATNPNAFYIARTVYNAVRKVDYDVVGSPLPAIFGTGGFFCTRFASAPTRQGFLVAPDCGQLL